MGRFFGRRPDPTATIARSARRLLAEAGAAEPVLAAVYVQRPGTSAAELAGGTSGAVGATVGTPPTPPGDDPKHDAWLRTAEQMGLDARLARRAIRLVLALTPREVVLLRRSRVPPGRLREIVALWPVQEVERIDVPKGGSSLTIRRADGSLPLELPLAHRFLPDVYRELPARLAAVAER